MNVKITIDKNHWYIIYTDANGQYAEMSVPTQYIKSKGNAAESIGKFITEVTTKELSLDEVILRIEALEMILFSPNSER